MTLTGQPTTHGAIAQKFRGPVGTGSGGAINTGFVKDYRTTTACGSAARRTSSTPIDAAWTVLRRNEQIPAR